MRLLFVCTGNICRSPTAEAVVRRMATDAGVAHDLVLESAGTGDWHVGEAPDPRAVKAAKKRGYDLRGIRARQVRPADFEEFDVILAMTGGHMADLERMCPRGARAELRMMLAHAPKATHRDVPDPYYGDARGFETMLDLIEESARGLLADVARS
ncbi:protein tyrosine phosphatase [Limimonas halophila]|uniref:protein-tyrosine-phosphatase n=1 Tax=Limimonas halophila TaxID=1082479 RepID=A0A1G7UEH7_9PROT|nr:low molecular weight protein-tyrosine-phosphatase [Limimonas halophila]SDG45883.1 protein tyrosine phosphatase [Limimonas halophila]